MRGNRNRAGGVLLKTVVFLLIFAILAGLVFGGLELWAPKGKNLKPSEWGSSSVKDEDPAAGLSVPETVQGKGIALTGEKLRETGAQTSYVITATVQPSYASDKSVTWSLRFQDSESEWATGKTVTDYVEMIPRASDTSSVTVNCKKAFGEPIEVVATSAVDKEKSATCVLDYIKRVTSVSIALDDGTHHDRKTIELNDGGTYTVVPTPVYGDGTIDPAFELNNCTIQPNPSLYNLAGDEEHYFHWERYDFGTSFSSNELLEKFQVTREKFVEEYLYKHNYDFENMDDGINDFMISGTYTVRYNETDFQSGNIATYFHADIGQIYVAPSEVGLAPNHIYF